MGVLHLPACITAARSAPAPTRSWLMPTRAECPEIIAESMLLKTVRVLSEIGALDLTAVTGTTVPVSEPPMVSIQQAFRLPEGGSQTSLGDGSTSNLVKDLLEVHEHITAHLRDKATHQIEQEGRPPHSDFHRSDFDRWDGGGK